MQRDKEAQVRTVYFAGEESISVAASGDETSDNLDVTLEGGDFTLALTIAGSGTIQVDTLITDDRTRYNIPNGYSANATGLTAGDHFIEIVIPVCIGVKFKFTETGTSDPATLSAVKLMSQ